MNKLKWYLVLIVVLLLPVLCYGEDSSTEGFLDEKVMELINNAVFEVVVLKPVTDSLTYERPLPLDLIPYSIRTDKYYSIGTAFAINPDQFVTAAHVINLDLESQYKEIYLRDNDGKIYHIDKILKYSDHRDFVMFSLKDKIAKHFFHVNTDPQINQRVYAVGNALGQGIVVRDGLYTSNTPEEENGEWQWLRFSAAASPGNSGGPLLDKDGKVIGIVQGKSENENLNYALSISEVLNAKMNTAVCHKKVQYLLDNMDMTKLGIFEKKIMLPKSYQELNKELIKSFDHFSAHLLKGLLDENRENIFPHGMGSSFLLHNTYSARFPHIIQKGEDGNWDAFYPSETKRAELGNNGYLIYGNIINSLFIYMQKPDNISLKEFYSDSKLFMDLILKGIYLHRSVGSEKVKIVSFGKAREEYFFTDSYKRKWMVRTWLLEFGDKKIATFSLPVPGGFVTILKAGQTGLVNSGYVPDLKVLADFIYLSYYGTFKQWQKFLETKEMLPPIFSTIKLSLTYGKEFHYASKRRSFSYTHDVMEVSEKSDLKLLFSYFKENGKTVWDVAGIVVGEDKNNSTNFKMLRETRPIKQLSDSYHSEWNNILTQKFPYNKSAFYREGVTSIRTVHPQPKSTTSEAPFLYTVAYEREGNVDQQEMETGLEKIIRSIKIYEGGRAGTEEKVGKRWKR